MSPDLFALLFFIVSVGSEVSSSTALNAFFGIKSVSLNAYVEVIGTSLTHILALVTSVIELLLYFTHKEYGFKFILLYSLVHCITYSLKFYLILADL